MTKKNISRELFLKRPLHLFLIAITVISSVTSCTPTKESYYFKTLKKDTTISGFVTNTFESKIKEGDILGIKATSLSIAEDALFNSAGGEKVTGQGVDGSSTGFLVRADGTVLLHRLGNVTAKGLTRKELGLQLQKELVPYMKDPVVNVTYLNHKVTIMGAVNTPQVINFNEEQIPLLDLLAKSGDLTATSRKDDIMIIREVNNEKQIKHINLEDHSILTSPWYYVQPNDIVYVMENYEKANKAERRARLQTTISLVVSGVSLLVILLDRIFR